MLHEKMVEDGFLQHGIIGVLAILIHLILILVLFLELFI